MMKSKENIPAINEQERVEFIRLASSTSMKEDMQVLSNQRHNPFLVNDTIDMDRALDFLNEFNEFINHHPKLFEPIIDKEMRL